MLESRGRVSQIERASYGYLYWKLEVIVPIYFVEYTSTSVVSLSLLFTRVVLRTLHCQVAYSLVEIYYLPTTVADCGRAGRSLKRRMTRSAVSNKSRWRLAAHHVIGASPRGGGRTMSAWDAT